jgi:hypothetical protein
MRKTLGLVSLIALVGASAAYAKGPDRATMTGPGLRWPVVFDSRGADSSRLTVLTSESGFWVQTFAAAASADRGRRLEDKPGGELGPRYVVVYRLPGPKAPSLLRQELYPYARTPVSYMPGQRYWGTRTAPGGWYRWGPRLGRALVAAGLPAKLSAASRHCPVSRPRLRSGRYGSDRLWVVLPPGGVLRVRRNHPDDGMFGTKIGWVPDRERNLTLSVRGERLDAPGRMRVRGVFWGYSSTGKGSWASAVAFPAGGCWRITGRAGPTTVSFVARIVIGG